jgi:hypothetical protein
MNGKVVDIEAGNSNPDARVIMWGKHGTPKKNQLWYQDPQGFIRSALNDFTFTAHGHGSSLKMHPATGDPRSQWTHDGRKISNQHGDVLDISRRNQADGAELISFKYNSGPNQHWRLEYV